MAGPFYNDGNYSAEVLDVAFDENSEGVQILFKVKILMSWDYTTGDWVPCLQQYDRTVWLRVPEEEEYKKYVVLKLRHAGWTGSRFDTLRDDMVGKTVSIRNAQRVAGPKSTRAGQTVEGWDFPLPERASAPLENKPQVAKKLNALFGKMLKETDPGPKAEKLEPVAAGNGAVGGGIPHDDVPFAPA